MNKNIILKTFNNIINKHNQFHNNINRVLREITDTKEEYEDLKKSVWYFYKKSHAHPVELMGMRDYENRTYTSVGDDNSVPPDWKGIYQGITNGLYYTGHNHPNYHTCFQSYADFENILIMNSKYSYTIGKDGFMIVKNTHNDFLTKNDLDHNYDDYGATKELVKLKKERMETSLELTAYNTMHHKLYKDFKNKYSNELEKITNDCIKYNEEFKSEYMDYSKYAEESNKLFQKQVSENIYRYVDDLNNEFKNNNVTSMKVYYCGKYETKKQPRKRDYKKNKNEKQAILLNDNEISGPHSNLVCKVALDCLPEKFKKGYIEYLKKEYPNTFIEFEKYNKKREK